MGLDNFQHWPPDAVCSQAHLRCSQSKPRVTEQAQIYLGWESLCFCAKFCYLLKSWKVMTLRQKIVTTGSYLHTSLLFQGHCWFLHGSHILFSMKRELRPPYGLDKTTPFPNNHIINGWSEKGAQNCVLLAWLHSFPNTHSLTTTTQLPGLTLFGPWSRLMWVATRIQDFQVLPQL